MKPHKWAKEITAWANGAEIEARNVIGGEWFLLDSNNIDWKVDFLEYRVKPQPKEPQYLYVYSAGNSILQGFNSYKEDLSDTWKYIGKIKLETDDD